jgi:hypothetical protein
MFKSTEVYLHYNAKVITVQGTRRRRWKYSRDFIAVRKRISNDMLFPKEY